MERPIRQINEPRTRLTASATPDRPAGEPRGFRPRQGSFQAQERTGRFQQCKLTPHNDTHHVVTNPSKTAKTSRPRYGSRHGYATCVFGLRAHSTLARLAGPVHKLVLPSVWWLQLVFGPCPFVALFVFWYGTSQ